MAKDILSENTPAGDVILSADRIAQILIKQPLKFRDWSADASRVAASPAGA
jgi:hypothetical protein